ncbi:hypothetical protein G7046_g6800 [Stylonectria norvegica]|nr:hypothetical protein G7046_g6800 [Stylonectria norvegica]
MTAPEYHTVEATYLGSRLAAQPQPEFRAHAKSLSPGTGTRRPSDQGMGGRLRQANLVEARCMKASSLPMSLFTSSSALEVLQPGSILAQSPPNDTQQSHASGNMLVVPSQRQVRRTLSSTWKIEIAIANARADAHDLPPPPSSRGSIPPCISSGIRSGKGGSQLVDEEIKRGENVEKWVLVEPANFTAQCRVFFPRNVVASTSQRTYQPDRSKRAMRDGSQAASQEPGISKYREPRVSLASRYIAKPYPSLKIGDKATTPGRNSQGRTAGRSPNATPPRPCGPKLETILPTYSRASNNPTSAHRLLETFPAAQPDQVQALPIRLDHVSLPMRWATYRWFAASSPWVTPGEAALLGMKKIALSRFLFDKFPSRRSSGCTSLRRGTT